MSDSSKKPPFSAEDAALWKAMTRDVRRLEGADYIDIADDADVADVPAIQERVVLPKESQSAQPKRSDIDRKTAERLRKGQIPINAKLDLHGYSQPQAHEALNVFIKSSFDRGFRCVLVITGKGKSGLTLEEQADAPPGVLKRNVPLWLSDTALSPMILRVQEAAPKHGGGGALYVLLRRRR